MNFQFSGEWVFVYIVALIDEHVMLCYDANSEEATVLRLLVQCSLVVLLIINYHFVPLWQS